MHTKPAFRELKAFSIQSVRVLPVLKALWHKLRCWPHQSVTLKSRARLTQLSVKHLHVRFHLRKCLIEELSVMTGCRWTHSLVRLRHCFPLSLFLPPSLAHWFTRPPIFFLHTRLLSISKDECSCSLSLYYDTSLPIFLCFSFLSLGDLLCNSRSLSLSFSGVTVWVQGTEFVSEDDDEEEELLAVAELQ